MQNKRLDEHKHCTLQSAAGIWHCISCNAHRTDMLWRFTNCIIVLL